MKKKVVHRRTSTSTKAAAPVRKSAPTRSPERAAPVRHRPDPDRESQIDLVAPAAPAHIGAPAQTIEERALDQAGLPKSV